MQGDRWLRTAHGTQIIIVSEIWSPLVKADLVSEPILPPPAGSRLHSVDLKRIEDVSLLHWDGAPP